MTDRVNPIPPSQQSGPPDKTEGPKDKPKKDFPPIKKKQKEKQKSQKKEEGEVTVDLSGGKQKQQTQTIESGIQPSKLSPSVEKVIAIFQDPSNSFFASKVSHVGVSVEGANTVVNVLLDSGINIEIDTRADDLNITIRGISAELQTAMENQGHQRSLRDQLEQAGFTIHQITTVRGDQPAATVTAPSATEAATPDTPEGEPGGGDTGGEGGGGGTGEEGPPEQ